MLATGAQWALADGAGAFRAGDVLDALEAAPPDELPWDDADPHIDGLLRGRKEAADTSGHNLTIAELAGLGRAGARAGKPARTELEDVPEAAGRGPTALP